MDMSARQTDLEPSDYVAQLQVSDQKPVKLSEYDGAVLIFITEDHYLVLTCDEHDEHAGHRAFARLFPEEWECFAQATNPEGWSVFHYGPAL